MPDENLQDSTTSHGGLTKAAVRSGIPEGDIHRIGGGSATSFAETDARGGTRSTVARR